MRGNSLRLEERVGRAIKESVSLVPYDPTWPESFAAERDHLLSCLPPGLIKRVEHFGSTAVPGLPAKPTIDMLVEVTDLAATRERIAPVLEGQGYDYFWRPTFGDTTPPFYTWFIKRNGAGVRTHHIHMIENSPEFAEHWQRLHFRDFLRSHPDVAEAYARLKFRLAADHTNDRVAYTAGKSEFIAEVMRRAK